MKKEKAFSPMLILAGLTFALLWSSASAATKIALQSAQPFVIAVTRFFIASGMMLFIAHIVLKKRLPQQSEWKSIAIYGFLNISVYLGLYVLAMLNVSAGLGTLAVGTNPVLISIISAWWLKKPIKKSTITSLLLCCMGIAIAAYPLIKGSDASPMGLLTLFISMVSYSIAAVYFSKKQWNNLHILTINGWQTLMGGIFLLPLLFLFFDSSKNIYDLKAIGGILWLAIPVSIGAIQLWLYLVKDNPEKAAFWLFLCPLFGFIIAVSTLHEPIGLYTFIGVLLVLVGLYMVQCKKNA